MAVRSTLLALALSTCVAGAGCSQREFVDVDGTVSWQGQPVEVGEIIFAPLDKAVAPTAGRIRKGAYKLVCKPGPMRVEIQAVRKTGQRDPKEGFEITELFIPRRFNEESELKADVTADGTNHFTFDLKE